MIYPEEASPKWELWGGAGDTEKGHTEIRLHEILFDLEPWAVTPALHKPPSLVTTARPPGLILAICPMQNLSKWIKKLLLITVNFQFMIGDTAGSLDAIFIFMTPQFNTGLFYLI